MIPNVAIIGLGRIGLTHDLEEKRTHPCTHVGVWSELQKADRANLIAVVDKSIDRRNDFAKYASKYNKALCNTATLSYISELEAIEKTIDIAVIATPTSEHTFNLRGLCSIITPKIIFVEKPIAERLSDAHYMIEMCNERGIKLGVNHTRRWDATYNSGVIRNFIKKIEPQHVTFNYPGPILRDGTHAFDVLRMWFGDAIAVRTIEQTTDNWMTKKNPEFTDFNYSGCIELDGGGELPLVAYYNGSPRTDYLLFEVDVIGKKGRLTIKDNGAHIETSEAGDSKRYEGIKELINTTFQRPPEYNPLLLAAENMLHIYGSQQAHFRCTGEDGYGALEIAVAFDKSWHSSSTIFLPISSNDEDYTKKIHSW